MTKGKNKRKAGQDIYGVYCVKCLDNKNSIKIKQLGILDKYSEYKAKDNHLEDKVVKLNDKLIAYFFTANITSNFLVKTKKLPVAYMFLEYNHNNLLKSEMFKIYLSFTIEEEVKSEAQLIHNELKGKYSLDIVIDEANDQICEIENFTTLDDVINQIIDFIQTDNMKQFIDNMTAEKDKDREEKYGSMFKDIKIPEVTFSIKDIKDKYNL